MNLLFGALFLLGGLALAVFLGIVLYREPKKEVRLQADILKTERSTEAA
jgi:hypothetical protein